MRGRQSARLAAVVVSAVGLVAIAPAARGQAPSRAAAAHARPIARITVSGAVHAHSVITDRRLCARQSFFDAPGIWLYFGRRGKLPFLSIQKFHRNAATHPVALRTSDSLAVGFQAPHDAGWWAGHYENLDTRREQNYGSGTVSANPALTRGTIRATLVWDSELRPRRPIYVRGSWDCAR